ncbi:MAG: hypothetical protein IH977_14045 [Nitrospinae bacterium]|nr:hypothetical protein [Nitrospinota bacterium]
MTSPWNAAEIKQRVDLQTFLLSRYGVTFRNSRAACLKAHLHAHGDKDPSMPLSKNQKAVKCFAGDHLNGWADCFKVVQEMEGVDFPTAKQICGEFVGLKHTTPLKRKSMAKKSPIIADVPLPRLLPWREQAGRLEMLALDLNLKAERTLALSKNLDPNQVPDTVLDRAMEGIRRAFRDKALAKMLEELTFTIRDKGLTEERKYVHAS